MEFVGWVRLKKLDQAILTAALVMLSCVMSDGSTLSDSLGWNAAASGDRLVAKPSAAIATHKDTVLPKILITVSLHEGPQDPSLRMLRLRSGRSTVACANL